MRFPFITRAAHERILRACEDAALERLESELAQADRAHQDALDRFRGRMRPSLRELADANERQYRAECDAADKARVWRWSDAELAARMREGLA
jgi:hypothetical protein